MEICRLHNVSKRYAGATVERNGVTEFRVLANNSTTNQQHKNMFLVTSVPFISPGVTDYSGSHSFACSTERGSNSGEVKPK